MKKFIDNVNNSAEASSILLNWGLKLAAGSVQLPGRIINPEKLLLGKGFTFAVNSKADWGRETTSNQMLSAVDLKKWVLVYVSKNEAVAQGFVSLITKLAPKMGMKVAQPDMKSLANDRTETYLKTIRDAVNPNVQMVVAIMPTPRDDRYSAVKKLCCVEQPVPSQVINFKTISNEKKVSSVVQKVALQINCKLGGELWGCQMPAKMGNIMVLGVDVYHDPSRRGSSIAGVVSSTNMTMSRWYSSTVFQNPGQELVDCLKVAFVKGLKKFYEANHIWPDKVIVFRDGVSDSQVKTSIIKYDLLVKSIIPSFHFRLPTRRSSSATASGTSATSTTRASASSWSRRGSTPGSSTRSARSWTTRRPEQFSTTLSPSGTSTTSSWCRSMSARAPCPPRTTWSSTTPSIYPSTLSRYSVTITNLSILSSTDFA